MSRLSLSCAAGVATAIAAVASGAVAIVPAAHAEPFVLVSGATVAANRLGAQVRLPDGSLLPLAEIVAVAGNGVATAPLLVYDVGAGVLHADLPGFLLRTDGFRTIEGALIASAWSGWRFVPPSPDGDLVPQLARVGTVAWRATCPPRARCTPAAGAASPEIFLDDLESGDTLRWSARVP